MGAPILPRMPLPAREHPASSCLPATERSLCPHVIAESLCGRNTDLGPKDPSRSLGKAQRRAASLQLLRPRAGAPTLLFKGGDQPRHGAIITPPRRPSESEPAGAGGGQGTQMLRGRPARTSTLPPWPWKPRGRTEAPPERAASGDSPQPGSPAAWDTHGLSPGRLLEAGPQTAGVPTSAKRHSGSQTHGSAVQAEGHGRRRDPSSACPAERLPNLTTAGPQPGPGPAGHSPPGAGYSSSPSNKGARRPDSRGRGHCRAWAPCGGHRVQPPTRPPPAALGDRPAGGPVMEDGGQERGLLPGPRRGAAPKPGSRAPARGGAGDTRQGAAPHPHPRPGSGAASTRSHRAAGLTRAKGPEKASPHRESTQTSCARAEGGAGVGVITGGCGTRLWGESTLDASPLSRWTWKGHRRATWGPGGTQGSRESGQSRRAGETTASPARDGMRQTGRKPKRRKQTRANYALERRLR